MVDDKWALNTNFQNKLSGKDLQKLRRKVSNEAFVNKIMRSTAAKE